MGCNTSKEAMQAVESRAELAKEKLQNLTAQGENILNNLTGKDKVDSPRKDEKVVQQEEEAAKGADAAEVVDLSGRYDPDTSITRPTSPVTLTMWKDR
ncbi:UNVERIFIED_CONTAM: hypothetical protein PYX00_006396 [Menopon gallinae]|uniref:Uncharacterized protein n=1 Tax=Menopon gallinae TaxID=328185 RepID=A0AAW2HV60_9NEOP